MKYTDEDYGYEMQRQKRLDEVFMQVTSNVLEPKVKIGSANLHRPQRYSHKDPAPWLQFPDETNRVDWESIVYLALGSLLVSTVLILGYYVL